MWCYQQGVNRVWAFSMENGADLFAPANECSCHIRVGFGLPDLEGVLRSIEATYADIDTTQRAVDVSEAAGS